MFADANAQPTHSKTGPSSSTPVTNDGYDVSYKKELSMDHVDAGCSWTVYWTDDNEVAEFTQVASEVDNFGGSLMPSTWRRICHNRRGRVLRWRQTERLLGLRLGKASICQHVLERLSSEPPIDTVLT